jgi:hypothetical protein
VNEITAQHVANWRRYKSELDEGVDAGLSDEERRFCKENFRAIELEAPNHGSNRFRVILVQMAEDEDLDSDDVDFFGECGAGNTAYEWECRGEDEDEVLDTFHATVPIAVLEDYEWNVEEIAEEE